MTKKIEQLIRSEVVLIVVWCNGSTSEFDSDSEGSIPSTTANGDFSVMVSIPPCEGEGQGSSPEVTPIGR